MADDPTDPTTSEPSTGDENNTTAAADLGDAGKKALDAERKARRDAEKRARDLEARIKEFEDRDKSEVEKLQEELADRDARLADLPNQIRQQVVRFASMASAAGFVDPEDALLNLGDIDLADVDAVDAALKDLADRKPHLVRQAGPRPAEKVTTRPKAPSGTSLGGPDQDPKAAEKVRAAEALRALAGSR